MPVTLPVWHISLSIIRSYLYSVILSLHLELARTATVEAIYPLASFTRLSPIVYLKESSIPTRYGQIGTTLILSSWLNNAFPKNISF